MLLTVNMRKSALFDNGGSPTSKGAAEPSRELANAHVLRGVVFKWFYLNSEIQAQKLSKPIEPLANLFAWTS